jgi:hypothetical protein
MKQLLTAPFVGWSALLSGVFSVVASVFLALFFSLEAAAIFEGGEPATPPLFGSLNDASYIFVALLLIPVALALHRIGPSARSVPSGAALAVGLIGMLAAAVIQALYVPRMINSEAQFLWFNAALGAIGLWVFLVNVLGRGATGLPNSLAWVGIVTGFCMLMLPLTYVLAGSSELVSDPAAALSDPLVIATSSIGLLGLAIGYPIWAIRLGRLSLKGGLSIPS